MGILGPDGKPVAGHDYLDYGTFSYDGVSYPFRTINEKSVENGKDPVLLAHAVAIQSADFQNLQMLSLKLLAEDTYLGSKKFLDFTQKLGLCIASSNGQIVIAEDILKKLSVAEKK